MINFEQVNLKDSIVKEVMNLGDFVEMHINGKFKEILDIKYGIGLNNLLSIQEDSILYGTKSENMISIVLKNGDIIEIEKSNKKYISRDAIMSIILKYDSKKPVKATQSYTKGNVNYIDKYYGNLADTVDLVFDKINNIYDLYSVSELPFIVEENRILFKEELYDDLWFNDEEHEMYCDVNDEQWCILELLFRDAVNDKNNTDTAKDNKIIMSNKFKQHMLVHQGDFKIPYYKLIQYMQSKGHFDTLKDGFVEIVVELPFNIGFTSIVETDETHKIIYAKRKGRDIYSRFTLNGDKRLTNKCVIVLNQSYTNKNEYYIVTMFPGEHLAREVQDKNIKGEEEKRRVQNFWIGHALVINHLDIDCTTITDDSPYGEVM